VESQPQSGVALHAYATDYDEKFPVDKYLGNSDERLTRLVGPLRQ